MQYIKILYIVLFCLFVLTACVAPNRDLLPDEEILEYCAAIIDTSSGKSVDNKISQEYQIKLSDAHVVVESYDKLVLNVNSLFDQTMQAYICICNCEYRFNDSNNVWNHMYRVVFKYDNTKQLINFAEVYDYEAYIQ